MSDLIPPFHMSRTPITLWELLSCSLQEPDTLGAVVVLGEEQMPTYVTCALARAMYPANAVGQA